MSRLCDKHFLISQTRRILGWLACLAALSFVGLQCAVEPPPHAGGSTTEVTNGIVACLVNPDQTPAAALKVAVRRSSHVAGDSTGVDEILPSGHTDSTGTVRIAGLAPGQYTLSTLRDDSTLGCVIQDITIGDSVEDPADTLVLLSTSELQPTGTLFGICGGEAVQPGSEITISFLGTDFQYRVQSDSLYFLQHLPPARYRVQAAAPSGVRVERGDVEVASADTLFIPRLSFADSLSFTGAKRLRFNTTATGANTTGDVSQFPLLVRLSADKPEDALIFASVKSPGALRFLDSTGTGWLPFEVERWDTAARPQVAELWVKVPVIYAQNTNAYITLLYGADLPDGSKEFEVFSAGEGFAAAWHLGEASGSTILDVTGNANHGLKASTAAPSWIGGIIGGAQSFDGVDDQIVLGADRQIVAACSALTVSAWIRPQQYDATILDLGGTDSSAVRIDINDQGRIVMTVWSIDSLQSAARLESSTAVATEAWSFVCGIVDFSQDSLRLYIDGVAAGAIQLSISGQSQLYSASQASFIGSSRGHERFFKGSIDECVVWRAARQADWIKLCYESQRQSGLLVQ